MWSPLWRIHAASLLAAFFVSLPTIAADAAKGQYLVKAAGCLGCHTETKEGAAPFAGGRALKTPFGIFYGPNITPHPTAGIGRWTEADFIRAMRHGVRPDGSPYYPAFPYPSFTRIHDQDLRDLWAYLRSLAPSDKVASKHQLNFPFNQRFLVAGWKWLFFAAGPDSSSPAEKPAIQRGQYLVQALGHCGECHTARNFLGALDASRALAGSAKGPDGKRVPNLTALKKWSDAELKEFLQTGIAPDGDVVAETMGEVIRNTTSQLTPEDLAAVIAYLRSLVPIKSGESQ